MELLLIGLIVYIAVQTVIIPIRLIKGQPVVLQIIFYLLAAAAAYFSYAYVMAGNGTVLT